MKGKKKLIILQSYSYNTAEVRIIWRDWEPISIPDPNSKNLPDFILIHTESKNAGLLYTAGQWDQLEAVFMFRRLYGYYILQVKLIDNLYLKTTITTTFFNIIDQFKLPKFFSYFSSNYPNKLLEYIFHFYRQDNQYH